jgi:hypothetical protein
MKFCELAPEIVALIFEFAGPVVLTEEYFTFQAQTTVTSSILNFFSKKNKNTTTQPGALKLVRTWYGRYPHSDDIVCLFPKIQISFEKVPLETPINSGPFENSQYKMRLKDKNLDLRKWLPSKGIRSLDLCGSMVQNTISAASLADFTELDEFKMYNSHWDRTNNKEVWREKWQNHNMKKFLARQKHIQRLEMYGYGFSMYDMKDEDADAFPTTLRHLNIRCVISCTAVQVNKIVAKNPNLESLSVLITGSENLDFSSASHLTHIELMSWDYPIPRLNIRFSKALRSFVSLQRIHLSENSATELLQLPHLEVLILKGQNPELAFPSEAYSHFAVNTSLKKLCMNDADFWLNALQYVAKCVSLEEIEVTYDSAIHNYESRIPIEEIKKTAAQMPSIKKWLGQTREAHEEFEEKMKDPEYAKQVKELNEKVNTLVSKFVCY